MELADRRRRLGCQLEMTVNVKDIRIRITPELINRFRGTAGIDRTWKPVDPENNIYDVRLTASDTYPNPDERHFKEDVERELEKFKIIGDRIRDSPLYVKTFDKQKVSMTHFHNLDDKALDAIDNVRSIAKRPEGPRNKDPQFKQWVDKSGTS